MLRPALLSLTTLGVLAQSAPARRPNLVIFLVDDLGWQDLSLALGKAPTALNRHFRTPHLEALARTGVRFTRAYAAPVSSPSRVSLLTGQHPARHGVTNWTGIRGESTDAPGGRLAPPPDWRRQGLDPGAPLLPRLLQGAGYRTLHVGKAHWGAQGSPASDPQNLGFDLNVAGHAAGHPASYQGEDGYGAKPSSPWAVPHLEAFHGRPVHLTEALTQEALKAVAETPAGTPFFLHFAHYAVHTPLQPHRRYMEHYEGRAFPGTELPISGAEARYASMVEGMDASLGDLLNFLKAKGLAKETLVVFASDNGGLAAHSRGPVPGGSVNGPLREGKGSAFEGGTRIPLVVGWAEADPAHPLQRRVALKTANVEAPVALEDLYPTLLAQAGLPRPRHHQVDGRDLGPLLRGRPTSDRSILTHYPHTWGPKGEGYQPHSALRVGGWKVIYFYEPQRWALYHLASDPGETRDLAESSPDRLHTLAQRLVKALKAKGARYPIRTMDAGAEAPAPSSRSRCR